MARISDPGIDTICGLSFCSERFPGTSIFPSPQKPTLPNSNSTRNQVDEEPLGGFATSKSLFVCLFIYLFIHLHQDMIIADRSTLIA